MTIITLTQDQINTVLAEHCADTEPPPVEPPPVEPPPVEPPVDPEMYNMHFRDIYGPLIIPNPGQRKHYTQKRFWVRKRAGLSMKFPISNFSGVVQLIVSKASHQIHGLREAQFSWDRGFDNPIVSTVWGSNSLRIDMNDVEFANRDLYMNVVFKEPDVPWDLYLGVSLRNIS